jgi:hypothetical protein
MAAGKSGVMPRLDPDIHRISSNLAKRWITGSSPVMTKILAIPLTSR